MNKNYISISALFSILFLLSSCNKNDLPEFNRLEGLRVLALQADTPEAQPGATVTITPIISDITANSLTYSVASCVDPGISFGAAATCNDNPTKVVLATNANVTLPGLADSWTGLADTFAVTIPADTIIFSQKTPSEIFNGVSYLVEYTLASNRGETVSAIKRILVSEAAKTAKNTNPVTTQIFADGQIMTTLPLGATLSLTTDLTAASAESYISKNTKLETFAKTESLTTTWFVTDGETKYYRSSGTDPNTFKTPAQAPTNRFFYLLAVTRDDRGGVSMVKKKF